MSWRPRDTDSIRTGSDMITFRPEITINLADTDQEIISQVATQLQDAAAARPVSRAAERTAKLSPRSVVANAMRARISGLNAPTSPPPRYRHDFGRDYGEDDFDHHTDAHTEGKVVDKVRKALHGMKKAASKTIRPPGTPQKRDDDEDSDAKDDCGSRRCPPPYAKHDSHYSHAYDEGDSHYSRAYDEGVSHYSRAYDEGDSTRFYSKKNRNGGGGKVQDQVEMPRNLNGTRHWAKKPSERHRSSERSDTTQVVRDLLEHTKRRRPDAYNRERWGMKML